MDSTLVVIVAVAGVITAANLVGLLIDLTRAEVRHLPKWAWALIIVLGSFPIGAIVYLVIVRVPADRIDSMVVLPAPFGPISP